MTWEEAILKSYESLGGSGLNPAIYEKIKDYISLSEDQLAPTVYGRRPAYVHEVRSYISNLVQSGYLGQVARGHYRLTEEGKARIRKD